MKKILPLSSLFSLFATSLVHAADATYEGMAKPWQLGFQEPATPVMEQLVWMHDKVLLTMCFGISIPGWLATNRAVESGIFSAPDISETIA